MSEHHKHLHHKHLEEHKAHSDHKHAGLKAVLEQIHMLIHSTLEHHEKLDAEIEARHAKEHEESHGEHHK
jgi:transcription termination factor NusB